MAMKLEYAGLQIEIIKDSDGFPSIKIITGSYLGENDRPSIDITLNDVHIHNFIENDYDPFSSERIRQNYDGLCPDCQEVIPFDVHNDDGCANCGHVFHFSDKNEIEIYDEIKRRDEKNSLYHEHEDVSN